MQVLVKNKLKISNASDTLIRLIKRDLTFDNPEFLKKEKLGFSTYGCIRKIVLYEQIGTRDFLLPFGCLKKFVFEHKDEYFDIVDMTTQKKIEPNIFIDKDKWNFRFSLKDYQSSAIEACVRQKNGVLVAPCGSGKTVMGLYLAKIFHQGKKVLWLTHTKDLLNQSYERAIQMFDINKSNYGKITEGKVEIGDAITFATVQTMTRLDLTEYENMFNCIIVDECHRACSTPVNLTMFGRVLNSLNCRYKIGLTATPERTDGLSRAMFAMLGDIIYIVPDEAVKEKVVPLHVEICATNYTPSLDCGFQNEDGTLNHVNLISDICTNKERNIFLAEQIYNRIFQPDTKQENDFLFSIRTSQDCKQAVLVLSERVAQSETLFKLFQERYPEIKCGIISSKNTKLEKELRKTLLNDLRSNKIDMVFATYQLAKEGLDIPNLTHLVYASPIKNKIAVTQSIGRVTRISKGKIFGKLLDFVDENFSYTNKMYIARRRIYKSFMK